MKIKCMQWIPFCISPLFLIHAAEAAKVSNTRIVYGAEQGSHLKTNKNINTSYMLQLASFKNQRYAITYKNKIASKTTHSVRVIHKPQSIAPYHVVIGPLTGAEAVVLVSQGLLHEPNMQKPMRAAVHTTSAPQKILKSKSTPPAKSVVSSKDAPLSMSRPWIPVLTVSGGPAWGSPGKTQTLALQTDIQKTYSADNITQSIGTGEIFLGVQRAIKPTLNGQLGLAVAGTSNIGLNGDIWEDGNPAFNNYFYQYSVDHLGLMAKGKLIGEFNYKVQPYVSAGLGVGFNRSHNFTITPRLFEEVAAPDFNSHSTTALTYTLGLGIQRALTTHWQAGIGYEFADWGQSSLTRATGQTMGDGLSLNHLYTNELLFSISYLR